MHFPVKSEARCEYSQIWLPSPLAALSLDFIQQLSWHFRFFTERLPLFTEIIAFLWYLRTSTISEVITLNDFKGLILEDSEKPKLSWELCHWTVVQSSWHFGSILSGRIFFVVLQKMGLLLKYTGIRLCATVQSLVTWEGLFPSVCLWPLIFSLYFCLLLCVFVWFGYFF